MRILHSSSDSFPFRYSGSISSAWESDPGTVRASLERITGFDIIQTVLSWRSNIPQKICLYQYGIWNCTDSSLVNCRSALSSGLGPVLILSCLLRQPSLSKYGYLNYVRMLYI